MRLPLWVMASMLTVSILAILFVLGWCWDIWPACTAARLFDHIRNDETDEACAMVSSRDERISVKHIRECNIPSVGTLRARPRTWLDLIFCRGVFEFEHSHKPFFTVERGRVVEFQLGETFIVSGVEYFR